MPSLLDLYPKEYVSWLHMRHRCNCETYHSYHRYGGRGIRVCERWNSFALFIEDMGIRPTPKHTLDRKDNDKDYTPENCRWATRQEQSRNRASARILEHAGLTLSIIEWFEKLGIKPGTIERRINLYGWSVADALTRRVQPRPTTISPPPRTRPLQPGAST